MTNEDKKNTKALPVTFTLFDVYFSNGTKKNAESYNSDGRKKAAWGCVSL
jgi:hypothetical protein